MANVQKSGIEITRKSLDVINGTLRPMGDKIVVRPLPLKLSQTIHANWSGKAIRGEVLAVGKGENPWIYNKDRSKRWQSKAFRPTEVKVGDIVELGGMELGGYEFPRVLLNGEEVLICSEKDVAVLREG